MANLAYWLITGEVAIQIVQGVLTGTGLMHLTNGVIDSAAWPFEVAPSSDQLIVTNHAGTDTAAITAAGDLAYASGSFTVTGLQGRPVASTAPSNGYALTWNSGAGQWQPQSVSITQPTGTGLWWEASGSLNAAAVSLTGDVSQGALSGSNVPLEVTGLLNKALPALAAGVLQYTGSAWALSTVGAGSLTAGTADQLLDTNHAGTTAEWFTVGGDLAYASHSFTVTGAQGKALPSLPGSQQYLGYTGAAWNFSTPSGIVSLGLAWADDLSTSTTSAQWVSSIGGASGAGGAVPLNAGAYIRGASAATIAAFRNHANSADVSALASDASDNLLIDTTAAVQLGLTNATAVNFGNLTHTASIGHNLTTSGSETWAFNGTTCMTLNVNALFPGTGGGLISNGQSANPWSALYTTPAQIITNGGVSEILSNAAQPLVVGFQAANASGAGLSLGMYSQSAKSGSGAASGTVVLCSGVPDGSGADGGIQFGFNVALAGTATDKVQFLGANSSAGRGNLQWSAAITPQLSQTVQVAASNPINFTIAPQGPNASSTTQAANTPGSFIVSLAAVGTNTVSGLHAAFQVNDNANTQFWAGSYRAVSSGVNSGVSAVWIGQGDSGFTPSTSNYAIANFAGTLVFNAPSGGGVEFDVGNATTYLYLTGGLMKCFQPLGGDGSTNNLRFNSSTVSIGTGGTTSPSEATLAAGPFLLLSASGTTTTQVVIDFSNANNQEGSCWIIDTAAVTFGASLGISVKNGSQTSVVTSASAPTGNIVFVFLDGTANRICWH